MTDRGSLALALLLSMAACRPFSDASEPAPVPAIARATEGARVAPTAAADAGLPALVSFARPSEETRWVLAIPHARRFRRLTLHGIGTVRLGWVREAEHVDETGTTLAPVRLVVERDGDAAAVAFGDLYGDLEPETLSFCARAGYRNSDGSRLETPRIQGFVSGASIGNTTGDQEVLVILAGVTLHVLERQTSDGMCAFPTRQGPMTVRLARAACASSYGSMAATELGVKSRASSPPQQRFVEKRPTRWSLVRI
jgi:hypothetical protein